MVDSLAIGAVQTPTFLGLFVTGALAGVGIVAALVKSKAVKGIRISFGGEQQGMSPCAHHAELVKETADTKEEISEIKLCVRQVQTDVAWLKERHEGYSAQTMLQTIIARLEANGK